MLCNAAGSQCDTAAGAIQNGTAITRAAVCSPKQPASKSPTAPSLGAIDKAGIADATSIGAATSGPAGQGPEEAESPDEDEEGFSDDDLSSWGSMDEIWDADSDYYDTEEEDEALAGTAASGCTSSIADCSMD